MDRRLVRSPAGLAALGCRLRYSCGQVRYLSSRQLNTSDGVPEAPSFIIAPGGGVTRASGQVFSLSSPFSSVRRDAILLVQYNYETVGWPPRQAWGRRVGEKMLT